MVGTITSPGLSRCTDETLEDHYKHFEASTLGKASRFSLATLEEVRKSKIIISQIETQKLIFFNAFINKGHVSERFSNTHQIKVALPLL